MEIKLLFCLILVTVATFIWLKTEPAQIERMEYINSWTDEEVHKEEQSKIKAYEIKETIGVWFVTGYVFFTIMSIMCF